MSVTVAKATTDIKEAQQVDSTEELALKKLRQKIVQPKEVTLDFITNICEKANITTDMPLGMPGMIRPKNGGVQCTNADDLASQKGVAMDLLKSLGSNLVAGKSIVNVSLPVRIFEPRSWLERLSDGFAFAPVFLSRAALEKDPVERMKLVVSFVIAGLHRGTTQRKPFNPILGETFQANFADGSEIFLEQISHHPPVSAFQIIGPKKLYMLHGHHDFRASFSPNGIHGGQYGPNYIDFCDGIRIYFHMPHFTLGGLIWGDRIFEWAGSFPIEDRTNNIKAEVSFNPDKISGLRSLFSSQESPIDTLRGDIYRVSKEKDGKTEVKKSVCKVEGTWTQEVKIDGKTYWSIKQCKPFDVIPLPLDESLPTDSRKREDLIALKKGDSTLAQQLKGQLEEKQRADSKARKAAAAAREASGTASSSSHHHHHHHHKK